MRALETSPWRLLHLWLPIAVWAALIWALSSMSGAAATSLSSSARDTMALSFLVNPVTAHLVEFGVLAVLLLRLAASRASGLPPHVWALAIVPAVLYGVVDEAHQYFVPGRVTSAADVGVDALGAMAGLALVAAGRSVRDAARGRR